MINWNRALLLRQEVGADDFDEVVDLFLCEVDEAIETLGNGSSGDVLAETLHFLKGSALNLGFEEFSALCHAGEIAAQNAVCPAVDIPALVCSYRASRSVFLRDIPDRIARQTSL